MAAVTAPRRTAHLAPAADAAHIRSGIRAMLPLLAGVAPLALVIGARSADAAIGPLAGWSTSWTIYSGSAQLSAVELLSSGASWATVLVTVTVLNLRLAVFATAMAPAWRDAPLRWRIAAGYLLVDPAFMVGEAFRGRAPSSRALHVHYLAGALTLWTGWVAITAAGLWVGEVVLAVVPADVVLEVLLISLIVPKLRTAAARGAGVLVAVAALPALVLPQGVGTLVAAALGAAVLVAEERRVERAGRRADGEPVR